MERGHAQQEQRAEYERGEEISAADLAVGEHDGAKEANYDAGDERKLNW